MKWVKQSVGYWCDDILTGKYVGNGICTAILDTGIARHPDLRNRISAFRNFTGKVQETVSSDDSGHGTHVAGILAGDGKVSSGLYAGMAPEADLIVGKVLDREGNGNVDNVLKGIDWILKNRQHFQVRIVNISVGTQPDLAQEQKQVFLEAVEELWDRGLVVVVSAGNYGPGESRSGSTTCSARRCLRT